VPTYAGKKNLRRQFSQVKSPEGRKALACMLRPFPDFKEEEKGRLRDVNAKDRGGYASLGTKSEKLLDTDHGKGEGGAGLIWKEEKKSLP